MVVPAIGAAKGIFEIFVPGLFLLVNLVAAVFFFPTTSNETRSVITAWVRDPALGVIIAISFGYLMGVLLRTLPVVLLDRLSAQWLRWRDKRTKKPDDRLQALVADDFPYVGRIGEICSDCLPQAVLDYYREVWEPRSPDGQCNLWFFNFCKILVNAVDPNSAREVYGHEAMCRYMCSMFYSLGVAACLMLIALLAHALVAHSFVSGLAIALAAYCVGMLLIVRFFRFVRVKEAETLFAATYANRHKFFLVSVRSTTSRTSAKRQLGTACRGASPAQRASYERCHSLAWSRAVAVPPPSTPQLSTLNPQLPQIPINREAFGHFAFLFWYAAGTATSTRPPGLASLEFPQRCMSHCS